jgi:hypothetical protein
LLLALSILLGGCKYDITDSKGGQRYKRKNEVDVLDQVHLYLKDSVVPAIDSSGHIKVAFKDIKKIEVYQKGRLRSTLSWVIPSIPLGMLVAGIVGMVVLVTSGNGFL